MEKAKNPYLQYEYCEKGCEKISNSNQWFGDILKVFVDT